MASIQQLVESGHFRILKLTVAVPGSIPQRELNHALLYAANKGLTEAVEILVQIGKADVDAENSMGMTGLMQAAQNGHCDIVKILIEYGSNVHLRNTSGCTALHYAAQYGHFDCVELLVSAGININTQDNGGNTALIAAAKKCLYAGVSVLELLAERAETKLNVQNHVGRTALHYVVNQADIITWCGALLAAGANPDIQDREGNTPFMLAATEGFDEVLKCLIAFHCNPDIGNMYSKKPIHFLAQKGHYQVIRFMMELHCDFDPLDASGYIPLTYAVEFNRPDAVKALLRANCKLEPSSDTGKNPLEIALEKQLWGIAKLLVLAGCRVAPLYPWLQRVQAEAEARHRERLTLFEEQLEEEEVDKDLEEAVEWFSDWLHKPHSLQQLTRIRIRGCITNKTVGKGRQLPIPPALQDYVTLKEVHDHHI